jgi:glycosyltransferase involved in cell wall biosynthesis
MAESTIAAGRSSPNLPMECSVPGLAEDIAGPETFVPAHAELDVALLTGCQDRPYAFGLSMALVTKGIRLDVIGSEEVDSPELHTNRNLHFLNLRKRQRRDSSLAKKAWKSLAYYARLIRYAASAKPKMFHILWNNKFEYFDRTLLLLYYKALGKKIVFTAHNVNQARRDSNDSFLNRLTLRIQYRLTDHIFVHTQKMKSELVEGFGVQEQAVTVIPFGINNSLPHTDLTSAQAKQKLGIGDCERAILFLGRIKPYKGLEYLLSAFQLLASRHANYRLIIAGEQKKGSEKYLDEVLGTIDREFKPEQIILKVQFIPDDEMELYLKAADVLVLPYKEIFQSGVLFLGYSFGLPVVATDVGSFREEIIEGKTGFLCKPADPSDMANTLENYFDSDLYRDLAQRRREIQEYANSQYSWNTVAELTRNAYAGL